VDDRYEPYCLADPLFYDSPLRVTDPGLEFALSRRTPPPSWERAELDDWVVFRPEEVRLPAQGWKIHMSACDEDAEQILGVVWDYCMARRICFKFVRGRHLLLLRNAKYAHRGSSGKFVTVYPLDEAQLEATAMELAERLDGRRGPYILSDLRIGAGPVYVRYGGFTERYCLSPAGTRELAITDADGGLVPDRRGPTFSVPSWVTLPDFLAPHLAARNATTVTDLPYRIEGALHFSNGGGVYTGDDVRTGARVVLKEARPFAGVDFTGADAVARLTRERDILERLAGLDVVPGVRDWLAVGDHRFLVLDFFDATSLYSLLVQRYPLLNARTDEQAAAGYTAWALDMYARVERAVDAVHERGVVIGDLHSHNVLIRPEGRVVLVDFEVAAHVDEGLRPMLAHPAFGAPRDRTGFAIDRYACLRLSLFLPLTTLLLLDRAKVHDLVSAIRTHFPVPQAFLAEAEREIVGAQPSGQGRHPRAPVPTPDVAGWERARASMARAILTSATPDRDDRLFPGDVEQFDSGGLSLGYGAAGVLYALAVTGAGRHPGYEDWLARRALRPGPTTRLGFYDGLHGVAYVLEHLGHRAEALKLLDMAIDELAGKWERLGLDLHGGLAGIGLNLAHFAAATGDPALLDAALDVAGVVADRLGPVHAVATISGGEHPYAGLLRGSSGPALMFVRLYEQTGDVGLLDTAAVALRQDRRRCISRDDGSLEVNEGWRTMPYLGDGSVGIGCVLEDYLAYREDAGFAADAAAIRRAAEAQFYVEPGLFYGRAGMILHLSRRHRPGTAARDPVVAAQIRRLAWHAISYHGHLAFPGEQLLKLSMDLGTGTAGVLLVLGAALHDEPVYLPFLGAVRANARFDDSARPTGRR
jgi:hypothetical protein